MKRKLCIYAAATLPSALLLWAVFALVAYLVGLIYSTPPMPKYRVTPLF